MTELSDGEKLQMAQLSEKILREAVKAGTYRKTCANCGRPIRIGKRLLCNRCESMDPEHCQRGTPDRRAPLRKYGFEDWE